MSGSLNLWPERSQWREGAYQQQQQQRRRRADNYPTPVQPQPTPVSSSTVWQAGATRPPHTEYRETLLSQDMNWTLQTHEMQYSLSPDDAPNTRDSPPPVRLTGPVPLPALFSEPILLHPIIACHASLPALRYDLSCPPSSATLPYVLKEHSFRHDWRNQPAMKPAAVGSLTISVPGVDRPVVVFPSLLDTGIVTINDVLLGVYDAIHAAAERDETSTSALLWENLPEVRGYDDQGYMGEWRYRLSSCCRVFRTQLWWGGLYPSPTENDVWILAIDKVQSRRVKS